MNVDDGTAKWLIGLFASAIGSTLWATFRAGRQSRTLTDALDDIDRLTRLVEGDTREYADERKRMGIVGRVLGIEGLESANANGLARVNNFMRAILRGLGIPSDLSDAKSLEKAVRDRAIDLVSGDADIDHRAARISLVADQDRRFGGQERPALGRMETPPPQVVARPRMRPTPVPREDPDDTGKHRGRR